MGDGLERGLFSARTPVPNARRQRRPPAAVGDRAALATARTRPGRATRSTIAREAGRARIPIYAIALGTPSGEVELRDSFGFLQKVQVPPDTETLKEIARALGRQVLHRDRDRQGQGDLRQPRHAALLAKREARGHRGVRGRRARAADRRRRPLAALVRPAYLGQSRPQPAVTFTSSQCMVETVVAELHAVMEEVRERTFRLVSHLDEAQMETVLSPIMSPLVVGSRPRRRLRGSVAQPPARRARTAARGPGRALRRVRDAPRRCVATSSSCAARNCASTWRPCASVRLRRRSPTASCTSS